MDTKTPELNGEVQANGELDKSTLLAVVKVCRKFNLKGTEEILKKEATLTEDELKLLEDESDTVDVTTALAAYVKPEGDPDFYDDSYRKLTNFIEASLDMYRFDLTNLLYPVFAYMYLELVYNGHEDQAISFMKKFAVGQEEFYQGDIKKLALVTKKEQMKGNDIVECFRSPSKHNQFTLRLSRDAHGYLLRFLNENMPTTNSQLTSIQNIIQEHIHLEIYDGLTRSKQQVEASIGSMLGEASKVENKTKVFYGLLKEPDISVFLHDDEGDDGEGDKPKKKKTKKELLSKKGRNDPNAPSLTRVPIPELRDSERLDKINALRESEKRRKLGPDSLPSICFYTMLNANHHSTMAICAEFSEDSNYLAAGFADSSVRVWSLNPNNKLKSMRPAAELDMIDKEADDVLYRMMDDQNTSDLKILRGHNGPVYAVSFSPDKTLLLSASEDATIRLWSLQTWTNLCVYKGHCFPVWDVKFSPYGYYFATAAHDRTARLWTTDAHQPLRIFAGHISDVDCVQFHPNCNYIATGSTDRSVRLWDVSNGQCVRYYTGHKAKVFALTFSTCGRYLVSAGADKTVMFWDIPRGCLVTKLNGHHDTIFSLAFSRDGTILASGGADDCIILWDVRRLVDEDHEEMNNTHAPIIRANTDNFQLGTYRTKATNILTLHFSRRNLLLSTGIFH